MATAKPASVLELYEGHPERWTQGGSAFNASGDLVATCSPHAVCWCIVGACALVYGTEFMGKVRIVTEAAGMFTDHWNDHPNRTFDEVLDLVRRAGV